ncbi:hypothetical protein AGMMS50276_09180 [Synergistales bacterium]|nr:hypothetical protein AGMMS50276_09180 [Synergistales bacterium]
MTDPLSREFSGDYPKFRVAAEKISAVFMGNSKNGDYLWRLSAFPKIPLQIAYSEADDEFPCEIKINFDSGVLRFMGFETVAFLNGSIANALFTAV